MLVCYVERSKISSCKVTQKTDEGQAQDDNKYTQMRILNQKLTSTAGVLCLGLFSLWSRCPLISFLSSFGGYLLPNFCPLMIIVDGFPVVGAWCLFIDAWGMNNINDNII